jgi:hypothetical protein
MLDWVFLLTNALWIIGLALALAVVSYGQWQRQEEKIAWGEFFNLVQPRRTLLIAGFLFAFGVGFNVEPIWQKGIWFVLAAAALIYLILGMVQARKPK